MHRAWLLSCAVGIAPVAWADPVTYTQAIERAARGSPTVEAEQAALSSALRSVRPAGQLPDPQLALGLDNFPVSGADRFRLDRDEMTMANVGVMQDVPSLATRRAREGAAQADVRASQAAVGIARLEAQLEAAYAWIDLHYADGKVRALAELEKQAEELERALVAGVAAGGADAALQAKLAIARLQDRSSAAQVDAAMARAELERWIGPLGPDGVAALPPDFTIDPTSLRAHVEHHVELAGSSAEIGRAEAALALARAGRAPDWSWSLMYGKRDPDFSDMVSFGLKFSLPLFQANRQAPTIDARRDDVRRAGLTREAVRREHLAMLESKLAEYGALKQRIARLNDLVAPLAAQREALAVSSHGAGETPLEAVFAMRLEARDVQLDRLELERLMMRAAAYLSLEYGESAQ